MLEPDEPMDEPRHEREDAVAELEALRALWREARPAQGPEDAGEELEATDARTRAAVQWMRAAWRELEVPEPRVPVRARGRLLRFPRHVRVVASLAAAALVLAPTLWLLLAPEEPASLERPEGRGELVAHAPSGAEAGATDDPNGSGALGASGSTGSPGALGATGPMDSSASAGARVPNTTPEAPAAPRVEPLVPTVGEGNLEFRSGSVRLVLVTSAGAGDDNPGDER